MEPILPSWFKQRQGKAEPAGTDTYKLSAPNLTDAFISIRRDEMGRWTAALRSTADGPEIARSQLSFATRNDAWEAAFELYRAHVIY